MYARTHGRMFSRYVKLLKHIILPTIITKYKKRNSKAMKKNGRPNDSST